MKKRCQWVGKSETMIKYHDKEWGLPCHNDKILFEYFILDTFQAGLSWAIVLNKRKNFKKAFSNYNIRKVAKYGEKDFDRLVNDAGIVRNRLKIRAAITNAQKFLEVKKEFGSFSRYLWKFTDGKAIKNKFKKMSDLPARTELSDEISADLKKRGFKFVGSTIIYAFMQGMGMVNDHTTDCFRYGEV
jgi:DNA-3-methyladenine glycosylase I